MNRLHEIRTVFEPTVGQADELSALLNELSFSYMMVTSAQHSLEDLDMSIRELGELLESLKLRASA